MATVHPFHGRDSLWNDRTLAVFRLLITDQGGFHHDTRHKNRHWFHKRGTDTVDQRRTHHTTDSFQPLLGLHIPPNARGRRSLMMNTIRYSWSTFRKSSTVFFLAPHIRRTLFQHWKLWSHCTDGTLCWILSSMRHLCNTTLKIRKENTDHEDQHSGNR